MTLRKLMLSALLLGSMAVPAMAEDTPPGPGPDGHPGMDRMMNADTDGDGNLSKAEFLAVQEKRFGEMDTNSDGKVTKDEMKAHRETMKAKFQEKRKEWESKKKAGEEKPAPADVK